jgi:pimeloyl-ACP methyl ester carboxylesterase
MMRLVVISLLLVALASTAYTQGTPRFEPADCPPGTPNTECGFLIVPLYRFNAEENLEIRVALARYVGGGSTDTPLIFLNGGPGAPILDPTAHSTLWSDLARDIGQDVIVMDMRGVGRSDPALNCPQLTAEIYLDAQLMPVAGANAYVEALENCGVALLNAGVEFEGYTTAAAAEDVNDLRAIFGYTQLDVWGNSYGSRVALMLLREHPDAVSTLVLDSVVPPTFNMQTFVIEQQGAAMEHIFAAHAKQCSYCADLETVFYDTVKRLNTEPAALPGGSTMDGAGFAAQILTLSHQGFLLPRIPELIRNAAEGDFNDFTQLILPVLRYSADSMAWGLYYSVVCASEYPYSTDDWIDSRLERLHSSVREGFRAAVERERRVCAAWDVLPAPVEEREAVQSSVPALLISGEFDPVTPLAFADQVSADLPNSLSVLIPAQAHGPATGSPCGMRLIATFLSDSSAPLDLPCVEASTPLRFTCMVEKPV